MGDAFGAPLEGLASPTEKVRDGVFVSPRAEPGTCTDDTEQALAVARSLVRSRGFSPEDMMGGALVQAHALIPPYGPTSRRVFDLVLLGMDPRDAARAAHEMNQGSRSNGSVMWGRRSGSGTAAPR